MHLLTTGVPLIQTMYEGNPDVALYTLPVLVWTTFHLLLASFLIPRLVAFVKRENRRLGIDDEEDAEEAQDDDDNRNPHDRSSPSMEGGGNENESDVVRAAHAGDDAGLPA